MISSLTADFYPRARVKKTGQSPCSECYAKCSSKYKKAPRAASRLPNAAGTRAGAEK